MLVHITIILKDFGDSWRREIKVYFVLPEHHRCLGAFGYQDASLLISVVGLPPGFHDKNESTSNSQTLTFTYHITFTYLIAYSMLQHNIHVSLLLSNHFFFSQVGVCEDLQSSSEWDYADDDSMFH